ncbi:MAG: dTDP-4-dehydrorhamnose reductase [Firmicutes bacterium]|nr:dTDP-4-dehydrorhamnose reductase [Bacillota bacterium]
MKIVITGSKGQLGNSLREILADDELYLVDLPELNLISYQATMKYISQVQPEVVIHCAAKTHVDDCELKPDEAYAANVMATKNVVNACQAIDAALVYVSTDYVFDGRGNQPYREYDRCNPQSVYGKTKWQGEEIVKMGLRRFYIARTAWLFGDVGHNFVRTILKLAGEKDLLKIVNDQFGCPTYAFDLAEAIHQLIRTKSYGIYHITNEGNCSWFEFTQQILDQAGIKGVKVEPITTEELNRPALRPKYSILAKDALKNLGIEMPRYQDALQRFFRKNSISPGS